MPYLPVRKNNATRGKEWGSTDTMLYEKLAPGLTTACSKRKKPNAMSAADKPEKCEELWCTGLITAQPMYANVLQEDV